MTACEPSSSAGILRTPYDSMYLYCLESHIDYENGETGRFNNSNAMFRAVFDAYRNWYNRTHRPLARAVRFY